MYEREATLCYMLGWIEGTKQPIKRVDALILLDQTLNKMCQPVMTQKEKDVFQELEDQQSFALLQRGIGRDRAKQIAREGHI